MIPALRLDAAAGVAAIGRRAVKLTPTQCAVLTLLLSKPRRVFSRAEIRRAGDIASDRAVDATIRRLRSRLRRRCGSDAAAAVRTQYGVGYQYAPDDDS